MHASRLYWSLRPVIAAAWVGCILIFAPAAHAEVTLDGTLGPGGPLAGPNYTISDDLGQLRGANLFHSFGDFTINTGESATFTGPTSVENILGRVTGGNASLIDGRLSSQIPGANLYLMNPSGLMFGPNATLDISGSFHATTADYIGLADGGRFDATTPSNSVLTAAPPVAFGFLGDNPRPLELDGSELVVGDGQTISLVGGDITIVGDASENESVRSPGGRINIVSVASPGEVSRETEADTVGPELNSFERLGSISLTEGALVRASSERGGSIFIRGGRFTADASSVSASVTAPTESPLTIEGEGIGIDIATRGEIELTSSSEIGTNVVNGGRADSGGIRIKAGELNVSGGAQINSVVFGAQTLDDGTVLPPATGNSGDIEIEAATVSLREGSLVRVNTAGEGDAGDIGISATTLTVDSSAIFSAAFGDGSGNTGHVSVTADKVELSSETTADGFATIQTTTSTVGAAGDVHINAREVQLEGRAEVSSGTFGDGAVGDIVVNAERVTIGGANDHYSGIFANTFSGTPGGSVRLTAKTLQISERGSIQAQGFGTGNAGSIAISTDRLSIIGLESAEDPFGSDATGIFAGSRDGNGGNVSIVANDSVTLTQRALMDSSSFGKGRAGQFQLTTQKLEILDGSQLLGSAFGSGKGADFVIEAAEVKISGVHDQPFTDILGRQSLAPSALASQSGINGGDGGTIQITARSLEVLDGAQVSTTTFGAGNGGSIELNTDQLVVAGENTLLRNFLIDTGIENPAGARATISTSTQSDVLGADATGNAGTIRIGTGELALSERGLIGSNTTGPGLGGTIEITADNVRLSSNAGIEARSRSLVPEPGNAGTIRMAVSDTFESSDSLVLAQADDADGGNIEINTGNLLYLLNDSAISATVGGGAGDGGNVTIDPRFVVLNQSKITANAFGGAGGNILIVADNFLASADSAVTASSKFGVDGDVVIRSPEDTVIVGVEALPESFLDASSLLSERCAARTEAKVGSFVVLGRGGVPPGPDAALPSSYADIDTPTDARSTSSTVYSHEAGRSAVVVRKGQRLVSGAQPVDGIMPARLIFSCVE